MKEFFDGSNPKDIFQKKLNSMMESLILIIQRDWKGTLRTILVVDRRDEIHYMQKERKKYIMGYEYALLEKKRNRPTNCSWGRDHNEDTDRHMAQRVQAITLLLFFQQCGVNFRKQAFSLSAVSWGGRLRKMESVTMADGRTVEEPGPCFLV